MKRVRINQGNVGLVFKDNNYQRVITEGEYWFWWGETIYTYDKSKPFHSAVELNLLLRDEKLAEMLHVVEVRDTEIVLHYENGNFKAVLTPGRYAFWNGVMNYAFTRIDLSKVDITEAVDVNLFSRKEIALYVRAFVVEAYEAGVLLVDGKFRQMLTTGVYYFWKNTTVVNVLKADLRHLQLEVAGQEILTKDKAALRVNFFAQYKVVDVLKALLDNKEYEKQLYILLQLALREYVGTLSLDELLERKESIAQVVMASMAAKAALLGVELKDCGVRDVILPGEMKDIMNQVLVAQKKAEANVIMRREETASTRSLLNTAKLMEDNAMLLKLKEMEYVEKIADKINSISLSGGNQIIDQLKDIFVPSK